MKDEFAEQITDQVLHLHPDGNKTEWGEVFLDLAAEQDPDAFEEWSRTKLLAAAGNAVSRESSRRRERERNERLLSRGVAAATGRPINPTMSFRAADGSRQLLLWIDASPQQFVDAVMREQAIVDGRNDANAVRLQVVELLRKNKRLMALSTLRDVCTEMEIDPDTLGLDELEAM